MNKQAFGAIIVVLVVSIIGACYTLLIWPCEPSLELSPERFYAVKDAIKRAPDGLVVVLGDSIVEGTLLSPTIAAMPSSMAASGISSAIRGGRNGRSSLCVRVEDSESLALGRTLELDATLPSNACLLQSTHVPIGLRQFLTILRRRPNDDNR